jgi:predicted alpha/beta-fold hydrolase
MAILPDSFVPRRGLRNGHAQTLAGNFMRRVNGLPPAEERVFDVEEDAQVLCHCHWQPESPASDPTLSRTWGTQMSSTKDNPTLASRTWGTTKHTTMTVVIVHGLEGSTDSQYVIGLGSKAWALGMNVVRMNMRNCGGTESLATSLYHSGLSDDVGAVVRTLVEQDRLENVALVGYSMGGNLVLKLAGEWGADAPRELKALCGVSPAMDLAPSADALHDRSNRIYEIKFLLGLKRRFERKARLFPEKYDIAHSRWFRSIREFDHEITARYSGFSSASDYYARASSANVVDKIAVPTLVLHALDDPFIRVEPQTRAKLVENPNVTYIETAHGGHCAFLASPNGYDGRWAENTCVEFIARQR